MNCLKTIYGEMVQAATAHKKIKDVCTAICGYFSVFVESKQKQHFRTRLAACLLLLLLLYK